MSNQELFHSGTAVSRSQRILYTPSNFAKASLFHLQEVGELQAMIPHSSHRSGLNSYLFFIVLSGSGSLTYHGRTVPLSVGDCVFIDCSHSYTHTTSDNLWRLKWCHFYGPNMPEIYEQYLERGGQPVLHPGTPAVFDHMLAQLYQIADSADHIRDMKINETLASLLTLLMQEGWHAESQGAGGRRQDIQYVKEFLEAYYAQKITLDGLADHFFINKFHLMRLFKAQYGMSINHYLQQIRITQAKQLLRFTDKKVEMIGLECGLGAHSYFTRTFKKVEGIAPSEYRDQWKL